MFQVVVSNAARADIRNNVEWWSTHKSVLQAERWYSEILESIYSLDQMPERCALAREAGTLDIELHNLLFGLSNSHTHRVLFTIDGSRVNVFRVLSTRQEPTELNLEGE